MNAISLESFLQTLQPVGAVAPVDAATRVAVEELAATLIELPSIDRAALARVVRQHPHWVPHLASCCRLSLEKLRSALRHGLGTSGWVTVARQRPDDLIALLDERFGLVAEVEAQRSRSWSFADVLVERLSAGVNAAGTVSVGRQVENAVEELVSSIGLPYRMRTEFVGRHGRVVPCDVAIPDGGEQAEIIIAIKSFGSTGSKQTDAAREFEELADAHASHQFAYAFCEGIGWLRRASDLRRIFALWERRQLDGVFNLSMMAEFKAELQEAARRRGLLSQA